MICMKEVFIQPTEGDRDFEGECIATSESECVIEKVAIVDAPVI